MECESIMRGLYSYLNALGFYVRTVSIKHLRDIEGELILRHEMGSIDENLFQERLTSFQFNPYIHLNETKSIIIIAVPQPTIVLILRWKGVDQQVLIPPTYDFSINSELKRSLEEIINPEGYHLTSTSLPLKLIAVRSGLAVYGRNNICYIPGKGSFFLLLAFFTDLPSVEDNWISPIMMERCLNCRACIVSCPLGAIDDYRFLLHAERCLSFHNEHASDFPKNIDPLLHHCLFGCLRCQMICPENKETIKWVEEREQFSEYETSVILRGIPLDQIPNSIQKKLDRLGLIEDYPLLARNLSVLLT